MLCSTCYHVYARLTHYRPPCTLPCTTCCAPPPPASNAFRGNGACSASLQRLCPVTCGACRACDTPRLAMIISAAAARARALSSVPLSARTGVHCCPLRSIACDAHARRCLNLCDSLLAFSGTMERRLVVARARGIYRQSSRLRRLLELLVDYTSIRGTRPRRRRRALLAAAAVASLLCQRCCCCC